MMSAYVEFAFARPKLYDLMFSLPLKEELEIGNLLSPYLKELISMSLTASQRIDEPSLVSRDRVISVLGQTHGLILFFRAGVFHSKLDAASKEYIDKLVQQSIDQ